MSLRYRAPRGTADTLPPEQTYWSYIAQKVEGLCRRFGYRRIDTPMFEEAGLFVRSIGSGTDIVEKEMYTFNDRGGSEMTLRPEGTAPVCRAYLEHGMSSWTQPVRLYYLSPIFRYERPQAGRYRQHHQFGCEALGDPNPALDAEVIELAWTFFTELGLTDLALHINSIGDPACRPDYLQRLHEYYRPIRLHLCPDCQIRYEKNPLRLLDCKNPSCQPFLAESPKGVDSLCNSCLDHWQRLLSYLDALGIPYHVDPRLVRGLDYYTRTVFEVQPPEEGSQSTLGGGGRYDGLMQELGGSPTPGVGFAVGLERVIRNLKHQGITLPDQERLQVFLVYLGREASLEATKLASKLRNRGVPTVMAGEGKSLKAQMRQADGLKASFVLILGEEELRAGTVSLRNLTSGEQRSLPAGEAIEFLSSR